MGVAEVDDEREGYWGVFVLDSFQDWVPISKVGVCLALEHEQLNIRKASLLLKCSNLYLALSTPCFIRNLCKESDHLCHRGVNPLRPLCLMMYHLE